MTNWKWNTLRELAAQLCADGQKTNEEIAAKCNTTASTFERWKKDPQFQARVAEHVALFQKRTVKRLHEAKEKRIEACEQQLERLNRVMAQRAEDYARETYKNAKGKKVTVRIPGGDTGLVVREPKGDNVVYSVDTGSMSEYRALLVQIATECGEWKQKVVIEGEVLVDLSALTDDQLDQAKALSALARKKAV